MLFDLVGKSGAIFLSLPLSLPLHLTPYALHLYTFHPKPFLPWVAFGVQKSFPLGEDLGEASTNS